MSLQYRTPAEFKASLALPLDQFGAAPEAD